MHSRTTALPGPRSRRRAFVFLLLTLAGVGAAAFVALAAPSLAATGGSGTRPLATATGSEPPSAPRLEPVPDSQGGVDAADGGVGDGVTVFDDVAAVTRLDGALIDALRRASTDAEEDGVRFALNSGWRSAGYQDSLLEDAIAEYGSRQEAARWVATPETSPHVRGEAVDMAGDAAAWLSAHGARYGLCQIYANESWHFELRSEAVTGECPAMYPDPTYDPRMQ